MGLITHLLLVSYAIGGAMSQAPVVDLGYSRYQGQVNPTTGNTEFLGIRFAAAPTGNRRWKEPQAPPHVNGIQLATSQPNRCHESFALGLSTTSPFPPGDNLVGLTNATLGRRQDPPTITLPPMSEDCLFLNVFSPPSANARVGRHTTKLPVLVWIHGGGFALGSASGSAAFGFIQGPWDGNDLIAQSGGKVVVVVIQYRLGLFGFLSSGLIKQDGKPNAGLLDQDFALKWVRNHISKFGGDPDKVTIWGESAGAGSSLMHVIANGGTTSPKLFRAAMISSAGFISQYTYNHAVPEFHFSRVVDLAGCSSAANKLACLRQASSETLAGANNQIILSELFGTSPFVPVIDGSFIRDGPTEALRKGNLNTKNLLVVTNTREGDLTVNPAETRTPQEFLAAGFPFLSQESIDAAAALYADRGDRMNQIMEIIAESSLICPAYTILKAIVGKGYKGEFAIPPAFHGDDLFYYFPSIRPPPFGNQAFIDSFAQSFLDFTLTLNPNTKHDPTNITPNWPKWSSSAPVEMVFGRNGDLPNVATASTPAALLARCDFWRGLAPELFQ